MMRLSTKKNSAVVGLDIEADSIAATEVRLNGSAQAANSAVVPLGPGTVDDGEVVDPEQLGESLAALFTRNKLAKEVRIGVANQRLAMRTLRLPLIEDQAELDTAVRFQAQDELPMPLDQAVLDFQVVGQGTAEDGSRQMEVAVVAARRDTVSGFMEAARRAGLRPVGIDLSAFGLIRALSDPLTAEAAPPDGVAEQAGAAPLRTILYCNLGDLANLAVARGAGCSFCRVAPFGLGAIARNLCERQGLTIEHGRQWMTHVGLVEPVERIEGDADTVSAAREALEQGAAKLVDELRLSIDYYSSQEAVPPVEEVVFSGSGTSIAGLTDRLGSGIGLQFSVARPPALAHLDEASAARLTVAYGLALEG